MNLFELQPTPENLVSALKENLIGRNAVIYQFIRLLSAHNGALSIALDSKWGSGKTFFVKQSKLIMDAYNQFSTFAKTDDANSIRHYISPVVPRNESLSNLLPHVSVYYDAWSNDNDVDPILSLIYEIIQSVDTYFDLKMDPSFLKVAGAIAELITGKNVNAFFDSIQARDPLAQIKEQKNIQELASEFLDALLCERGNRLVIFIDELDRCKPSYAVQLLERIKHYFTNERITFVFSVNLGELQHTIRNFYGNDFDACRYLDRFFDLRILLPPANLTKFYEKVGLSDDYTYELICKKVIDIHHFQLREITRFYVTCKMAGAGNQRSQDFPDGNALSFGFLVIPIMIGLRMSNIERYNKFVEGRDSSPLIEIFDSEEFSYIVRTFLLESPKDDMIRDGQMLQTKVKERLNEVYKALFVYDNKNGETISIGKMAFGQKVISILLKTESLLSSYADYDS